MTKLLTQKDVAVRWKMDVATIKTYRIDGILTPCKGIPSIRFTEQHILEIEGVKLDKLSPLERKRLEREVEELKIQNMKMKEIISKVVVTATQIYIGEVNNDI